MARTRRAARTAAASAASLLIELPDDLLAHVVALLLDTEIAAAVRLLKTAKVLRSKLAQIQHQIHAAAARRMWWDPALTSGHGIEDDGRTAICERTMHTWAASNLLPTSGRVSWTVEMTSQSGTHNETGICDGVNTCAWTIDMGSRPPTLGRTSNNGFKWDFDTPAPAGFPLSRARFPGGPRDRTIELDGLECDAVHVIGVGTVHGPWKHRLFEFTLDIDAGELWMSVHGCEAVRVLSGLPPGRHYRACAIIHDAVGSRAILSPYWSLPRAVSVP